MKHLALALVALAAGTPAEGWKAGVGRAVITPEAPMWMSGYASRTKPAEGKVHDLWVKALALEDPGGRRALLLTADLVGISKTLADSICGEIKEKLGLDRDAVLIATSHTHCGPMVKDNLHAMFALPREEQEKIDAHAMVLRARAVGAAQEAFKALRPARLSRGLGSTDFAVNRRNNKEADVPQLRAAGQLKGPVDHDVPVLAVRDPEGGLRAVVFLYACHNTTLGFQQWCGDYAGFAQVELEKAHPGAAALFMSGCGADQNPIPRRSVELAERYGKKLADAVDAALRGGQTPVTGRFKSRYGLVDLAFDTLPTREELTERLKEANVPRRRNAELVLEQMNREGAIRPTYPYPIQVWGLGDLTLVALGGEVVVDYALRLKKELGADRTWVAAYCNDVMGYIPSERVLKEGGYEGATSIMSYALPAKWAPGLEEKIVSRVRGYAEDVRQARGPSPRRVRPDPGSGTALAVSVRGTALLHTGQLLPVDAKGSVPAKGDAARQTERLLEELSELLRGSGCGLNELVKVNLIVADSGVLREVKKVLAGQFPGSHQPAVAFVAGRLPHPDALVGLDAVAATTEAPGDRRVKASRRAALLPAGPRVYVSGQAERGEFPEATRKTLESLRATLEWLGLGRSHVVQLRFFMQPISEVPAAEKVLAEFFGGAGSVPPVVYVEWKSALPVEIELIAAADKPGAAPIEYLTPPGIKASPIYSRVARLSHPETIYISGLTARADGDGAAQVRDVFAQLGEALRLAGSDLQHLAKATYYVSDADADGKLNQIRPEYYDPLRPPAASKARVAGTGVDGRTVALDMIAVPSK